MLKTYIANNKFDHLAIPNNENQPFGVERPYSDDRFFNLSDQLQRNKFRINDHFQYRLFLLSIIRHLEGKSKVFSTLSVNDLDNMSHKFNVCTLR